jgi:hypothetical protein
MNRSGFFSAVLVLMLALPAGSLMAQQESRVTRSLGTIDEINQDYGYIIVDGNRMEFRDAEVVITYRGMPIRSSLLSKGIRISYTTGRDGSVSNIALIGPTDILQAFDQH